MKRVKCFLRFLQAGSEKYCRIGVRLELSASNENPHAADEVRDAPENLQALCSRDHTSAAVLGHGRNSEVARTRDLCV
jgi:hypothetical protein